MSVLFFILPPSAHLVTYGTGRGFCSIWTQEHATSVLRVIVPAAGLPLQEDTFHFLHREGYILAAAGASGTVLEREGRWSSDSYDGYVRSNKKYAVWVTADMAHVETRAECTAQAEHTMKGRYAGAGGKVSVDSVFWQCTYLMRDGGSSTAWVIRSTG